jgi:pSer/pThr/pTyr-binding forkhead associated (FHA) protein
LGPLDGFQREVEFQMSHTGALWDWRSSPDYYRGDDTRIVIRKGPGSGHVVPLSAARVTIGRAGESDVSLQGDWCASRRHCEMLRRGDNWSIVDVGSTNGTLVNGRPISRPTLLQDGDIVSIGMSELVILSPGKRQALIA